MSVKTEIALVARALFNESGVRNVTLRDIAQALSKSYGNITYHYPDKAHLIEALYERYLADLAEINQAMVPGVDLMEALFRAPVQTFALSMKHLFLFVDYVEIRRAFPEISRRIDQDNLQRMEHHLEGLKYLRAAGILQPELSDADLWFLMELSGAVRTFFFLQLRPEERSRPNLQEEYVEKVNRILLPYLNRQVR